MICSRRAGRPGAVDEVPAGCEAETRRTRLRGRRARLSVDRVKASRSFLGALGLTTRKMRTHPIGGDQDAEQIRSHEWVACRARPMRNKEDRGGPGQRRAPPRQGVE